MATVLIGYSGHAYVVADVFRRADRRLLGYCDRAPKDADPYGLAYLGPETDPEAEAALAGARFFVAIGDNALRRKITHRLLARGFAPALAAVHPRAVVAELAELAPGVLVAAGAIVNPLARVAEGAIINSGAIVEHECTVGAFAHVAPGAVLTGNVSVGAGAFVGAGSVVKPGISIGEGAIIGAGAVVLRDISPGATAFGNPAKPRL